MLIQILKDQNTPGQETFLMRAVRMNHLQGVQRLLQAGAGFGKICNGKLALHLAVVFADLRIISLLLANNACVNLPDHVGDTALILATMRNDSEILNLLIDNGALVNFKNREGQTALLKAVSGKFTTSVRCLLERGADVSIIDQNGNTALILASMNGSMDVVQMLTQAGADVNMVNSEGETALLAAVAGSRLETVNFLLDFNVDLNHKNKSGNSALIIAAEQNDVSCVEALLARGADVNQINTNGDTALMIGSAHGSVEMVKSLLFYEADANLKDVYGNSSLVSCVARYTNVLSGEKACCENFADFLEDEKPKLVLIIKSLIEASADVNDVTNREGNPVLFDVIRAGDLDLVKLFLPTADLEQRDLDGNTAAIVASEAGRLPILQELLGRGACVNAANSSCLTALHKAIMMSDVDMVKTLIAAGAEVNLDDPDGNVYLNLAQSLDNTDVVEALKTALGLQHDPMKVF
ncbi:ankyrin repeat domain-containing protein 50-like [Physella acuta]|uniref:ankyrin repeat domain-containing protein 50-like n=1 Tax=Physella acuta TaxID=109671 RepID=UPI0027DE5A8C|nr:ankyrin repeat domain-containing protein 50-like [Physella acuta]XP_059161558.1 ankyrin repeat domain-containing protein 50-like [Physella acuta]